MLSISETFIYNLLISFLVFYLVGCGIQDQSNDAIIESEEPYLVVLGNVQDGGSPHIGCSKDCCNDLFDNPDPERMVVSLGLVDPSTEKKYLFEATPDIATQLKRLKKYCPFENHELPNGIFITHAHIGHYTGLMYLGKEAKGAQKVPVYVMHRMKSFLENNGPWNQLIAQENIALCELKADSTTNLDNQLMITPFQVPHRDEYSETVGFRIQGKTKSALFIPDIDKWEKWDEDIVNEIKEVDLAFIDGTFFNGEEIDHRDISQIPHPFVIESLSLFSLLPENEKSKIHFIHFNHTNPLLNPQSDESKLVLAQGFRIARLGMKFEL